jgi:hypothetical protein
MVRCVMDFFSDLSGTKESVTLEELTGYEGRV